MSESFVGFFIVLFLYIRKILSQLSPVGVHILYKHFILALV